MAASPAGLALSSGVICTFGSFRLDADRFELSREGVPVTVEPQVLELTLLLSQRRGRPVPKEEIVAAFWGGRASLMTVLRFP